MPTCDICGEQVSMPYQCHHCGGTFCGNHRLPESHDCSGLQNWGDPGGVFDSGFDDSVADEQSTLGSRFSGPSAIIGYFRGNMSMVFLAAMMIVFLFQFILYPALSIPPGSRLWNMSFTLDSQHPEYLWTWITSIFSHGGIYHIFANGLVLFFFGPLVERKLGSRDFTLLFLGSGLAAGLAQLLLSYATGDPAFLLGASGAIMAVMGVLTVLNPDLKVLLYFFIPVPIWLLTVGYAALSVLGMLSGFQGGVAHGAHLAGLIIGLIYGKHEKNKGVSAPGELQFGRRRGPGGPGRGRF